MGTFGRSFFRSLKMPTSEEEKPENKPNPQPQNQLSPDPWEAAYLRFESPEEEIQKFIKRLTRLGAPQWPRDAEIVELLLTPFLKFVHTVSENPLARRVSNKMDALATMIQFERRTYEQWLGQPELIKNIARAHFLPLHESFTWGKWNFVGAPR